LMLETLTVVRHWLPSAGTSVKTIVLVRKSPGCLARLPRLSVASPWPSRERRRTHSFPPGGCLRPRAVSNRSPAASRSRADTRPAASARRPRRARSPGEAPTQEAFFQPAQELRCLGCIVPFDLCHRDERGQHVAARQLLEGQPHAPSRSAPPAPPDRIHHVSSLHWDATAAGIGGGPTEQHRRRYHRHQGADRTGKATLEPLAPATAIEFELYDDAPG